MTNELIESLSHLAKNEIIDMIAKAGLKEIVRLQIVNNMIGSQTSHKNNYKL